MANYKPDLSCQSKFIPIDFSQQIVPGTFEYALAHIVDHHLDLSGFDAWYRKVGLGSGLEMCKLALGGAVAKASGHHGKVKYA